MQHFNYDFLNYTYSNNIVLNNIFSKGNYYIDYF